MPFRKFHGVNSGKVNIKEISKMINTTSITHIIMIKKSTLYNVLIHKVQWYPDISVTTNLPVKLKAGSYYTRGL